MHLKKGWLARDMKQIESDHKKLLKLRAYARKIGYTMVLECASCVDGLYKEIERKRTRDGHTEVYKCDSCGYRHVEETVYPDYNASQ